MALKKQTGIQAYPRIKLEFNPKIPPLKKVKDKTKINVRYALIPPFAFVHIYWDPKIYEMVYEIEEPILTEQEKEYKEQIISAMRDIINFDTIVVKDEDSLLEYIDRRFKILAVELGINLSYESYKKIYYYLARDFMGFNEVEPLLRDYFIEDIECNGLDTPVYVIHRIYRNLKTNLVFKDVDKLAGFVEKLAQRTGKYISYANPILDGSLPDGSRVNATYTKDITSRGPTFTIRKFTKTPWTPIQLLAFRTLSPEMMAYIWLAIQYKMNFLVTGGTASGKTTLLNAISFFIPPESRIVSIEDSVTGDSRIIIKENNKIRNIKIKELVEKEIDAEVMTLDEKGKIIWVKPSKHIKHNVNKNIYEILTQTGRKVKVTQDHSLFTLRDSGLEEVKPTDLKEKESFIAVPRSLPLKGRHISKINLMNYLEYFKDDFLQGAPVERILENYSYEKIGVKKQRHRWWKKHNIIKIKEFLKLDENFSREELKKLRIKSKNTSSVPVLFDVTKEFLEYCGLWVGDGSYDRHNKNSVIVSNIDEECRDVIRKVSKYLGSNYSAMNDKETSLRIHSTVFYKLMKNVLGFKGRSSTKKIPDFIHSISNNQMKHFLRGYFSADGTVKNFEVSCASQSYSLLEDIQTLFLRLDIISRINDFDRKDKCINLSISSHENIQKYKQIGFLQERKNKKLALLNKKAHHTHSDIVPLSREKMQELSDLLKKKLQSRYLQGYQRLGRNYIQKIAPTGSEFNDLSHNEILWDRVKKIKKIESKNTEVFDLSIPEYEKFICNNIIVHNTRELNLSKENWLPSVTRSATGLGKVGEIDLFTLLRSSFRQNPDYVIVGEVRGKEAYVLFQGMASGHSSLSTIHADSIDTVIKRLETPPIELSPSLLNILDGVCIMTHAIVKKEETRKLREIVEVVNVTSEGVAMTNTPFIWNSAEDQFYFKKNSHVLQKVAKRYGLTVEELNVEFRRRSQLLYNLYQQKIFDFEKVQDIIDEYYKKPEQVLQRYGVQ